MVTRASPKTKRFNFKQNIHSGQSAPYGFEWSSVLFMVHGILVECISTGWILIKKLRIRRRRVVDPNYQTAKVGCIERKPQNIVITGERLVIPLILVPRFLSSSYTR
jgi:hypothetical protein